MLQKPEIGQIVITKGKCFCYCGRLEEGEKVIIAFVDPLSCPSPRGVGVRYGTQEGWRWHCVKCLRRPKRDEISEEETKSLKSLI